MAVLAYICQIRKDHAVYSRILTESQHALHETLDIHLEFSTSNVGISYSHHDISQQ